MSGIYFYANYFRISSISRRMEGQDERKKNRRGRTGGAGSLVRLAGCLRMGWSWGAGRRLSLMSGAIIVVGFCSRTS